MDKGGARDVSTLGGLVVEDGVSVHVHIYREGGRSPGWVLEVVDHTGASTVWDCYFPTDQEALRAFRLAVEEYGIASFAEAPSATLH